MDGVLLNIMLVLGIFQSGGEMAEFRQPQPVAWGVFDRPREFPEASDQSSQTCILESDVVQLGDLGPDASIDLTPFPAEAWNASDAFRPFTPLAGEPTAFSEESFDLASGRYRTKHVITVPIAEGNQTVLIGLQAQENVSPGRPWSMRAFDEAGRVDAGLVGVDGRWRSQDRDLAALRVTYHYDLWRPAGDGLAAAAQFLLREKPVPLYVNIEARANWDGSNMEKISLAAGRAAGWGDKNAGGQRITARVGIGRQDSVVGWPYLPPRYLVDWGILWSPNERLSQGVTISYSWNMKEVELLVYVELKAPTRPRSLLPNMLPER
jgi:hypothetical protein